MAPPKRDSAAAAAAAAGALYSGMKPPLATQAMVQAEPSPTNVLQPGKEQRGGALEECRAEAQLSSGTHAFAASRALPDSAASGPNWRCASTQDRTETGQHSPPEAMQDTARCMLCLDSPNSPKAPSPGLRHTVLPRAEPPAWGRPGTSRGSAC